jgi:hypothetical protein
MFLAFFPLLLNFSVWFLRHLSPILDRSLHTIKADFSQHPYTTFFFISALLDCIDVFKSLYSLLFPFMPSLQILACCECHESVFLELGYLCSEHVPLMYEPVVSRFELASQTNHGLSGALIVFNHMMKMFLLLQGGG